MSKRVKCSTPNCGNKINPSRNFTGVCGTCAGKPLSKSKKPADTERTAAGVESFEESGNTATLTKDVTEDVRSLDQLIAACAIDTETWDVERYVCNKWAMGSKHPKTGAITVTPLFQVKAWLKRKVQLIAARAEIAQLFEDAKQLAPVRPAIIHPHAPSGHMLELALPDVHVGKLAWSEETGGENYDTKIAVRLYHEAVERLLSRVAGFAFERILLPLGNDLLNADNREQTTTRGTPQHGDGRYQKTFRIVRQMVTETIEKLRLIAPVDVLIVPGNHDTLAAWHLGDSLSCLYHNTADVQIDNRANLRKYKQFGRVMLMFCHGDKGKKIDYPLVMAREEAAMWGETEHREIHLGHTHESKVSERHGVRTRVSPALCPADAWHAENFYVGNARAAEAYVWHREEGLINLATWTVPQPERKRR